MTDYRAGRRLRRALFRRGLTLEIGRVRDPAAIGYGQCTARDTDGKVTVCGTVTEVEQWLARTSPSRQAFVHSGSICVMDRRGPAKRRSRDQSEAPIEKACPKFHGYLVRWQLAPHPSKGGVSLHKAFVALIRWNICQFGTERAPALADFRKMLLPAEEWTLDDGRVLMVGYGGEPWLLRLPDGTIECFDPEAFGIIYGRHAYADFGEPGYAMVEPTEERLYYDESAQDEAAMKKAAEDALRVWGMPVPIYGAFTAWAGAIEAEPGGRYGPRATG